MTINGMISLYSGCGGLDLGFHQAGFKTAMCVEQDETACSTLALNNIGSEIYAQDICTVDIAAARKKTGITARSRPDVLVGGPPCPAYSKSRFYRKEMPHGVDDPAFETVRRYFEFVEAFKPKVFVFENVHTFAAERQKGALQYVLRTAASLGYKVDYRILNAVNYGVPQKRERLFVVGYQPGMQFQFPSPTHRDPSQREDLFTGRLANWATAGDAIADIDDPGNDHALPRHYAGGRHHELLKQIPEGDNYLFFTQERGHPKPEFKWRSRYWSFLLKLSHTLPSWTIQARRSNNMGPFHWRNRILTINEVKRLQTFPDDFVLVGNLENQWRQIGNAVPPRLAYCLAMQVRETLEGYKNHAKAVRKH